MWMVCQYIYSSIFNLECVILYAIRKYTQAPKLLVVKITWFVRIKITCIILLFITHVHIIFITTNKIKYIMFVFSPFQWGWVFDLMQMYVFHCLYIVFFVQDTNLSSIEERMLISRYLLVICVVGLNDYSSLLYTYFYLDQFEMLYPYLFLSIWDALFKWKRDQPWP